MVLIIDLCRKQNYVAGGVFPRLPWNNKQHSFAFLSLKAKENNCGLLCLWYEAEFR